MLDDKDQAFYDSRMLDSDYTNITIIRPKEDANKEIEPFLGFMENWSQMYSGNSLRAKNKKDQRLVDLAQRVATKYIETYNSEFLPA